MEEGLSFGSEKLEELDGVGGVLNENDRGKYDELKGRYEGLQSESLKNVE
ncbi:hypothetical protein [Staphylococcus haemolyticus]|nr:hypothetical protein [Staphylococcus haemolyticus]